MKNKLSQFGKNILIPAASLVVLFIGAGSAVTVATTQTLLGTDTATSAPPVVPSSALADFCEEHWGELYEHGRYCRFEQWFHLNLKHAGADPVLTAIPIMPGDTLRLESATVPEALIGDISYDAGDEKIVARVPGYLAFRAAGAQSYFTVERLGLERCFAELDGRIDTIPCPSRN